MPKSPPPAIAVRYSTLVALLGKSPKDPAVEAVIAKAGKVTVKSDFIIAKDAGFDFSVGVPANGKTKVLKSLFLFPEGGDKHRGFADLPKGFSFTTRADLLAELAEPETSWKLGKGKVNASTEGVMWDRWAIDGFLVSASYRGGSEVRHLNVTLPEEASGGVDLSTHPLHFATKPADAPKGAELVGMALLVAWAADRFGLPPKHASSALGKQLLARKISPRTFLVDACGATLTSLDLAPKLKDFVYEYLHHVVDDEGARKAIDAKIEKLLGSKSRTYPDDFLGTFEGAVGNPFHVPDSWEAVDRIAPVIDARLSDFEATGFTTAPKLGLYEKAAKLRDQVKIVGERAEVAKPKADDKLAEDLVALIGKPLKDPKVKEVLARAGLPVGKRIDEQGNPALGVTYMGTKFDIAGSQQLGVDGVDFYAKGQSSYVRGIGAEVEFEGFPGPLPHGVSLGEARGSVVKKLSSAFGAAKSRDDREFWKPKGRLISARFANDKLVHLHIGQPPDY